jgi:hypothetical protein
MKGSLHPRGENCPSPEIVKVPFLVPNENGFTDPIGDPWIREVERPAGTLIQFTIESYKRMVGSGAGVIPTGAKSEMNRRLPDGNEAISFGIPALIWTGRRNRLAETACPNNGVSFYLKNV